MRHIYEDFIDQVSKPTRYLGSEYMSANKDISKVDARVLLAFPDVYAVSYTHLTLPTTPYV